MFSSCLGYFSSSLHQRHTIFVIYERDITFAKLSKRYELGITIRCVSYATPSNLIIPFVKEISIMLILSAQKIYPLEVVKLKDFVFRFLINNSQLLVRCLEAHKSMY